MKKTSRRGTLAILAGGVLLLAACAPRLRPEEPPARREAVAETEPGPQSCTSSEDVLDLVQCTRGRPASFAETAEDRALSEVLEEVLSPHLDGLGQRIERLNGFLAQCTNCTPGARARGYAYLGAFFAASDRPDSAKQAFTEALRLSSDVLLDAKVANDAAKAIFARSCDEMFPTTPEERSAEDRARQSVAELTGRYAADARFDPVPGLRAALERCHSECRPVVVERVRAALDDVETASWEQVASLDDIHRAESASTALAARRQALEAAISRCGRTRCEWWVPTRAWFSLGALAVEGGDVVAARRAFQRGHDLCPDADLPKGAGERTRAFFESTEPGGAREAAPGNVDPR